MVIVHPGICPVAAETALACTVGGLVGVAPWTLAAGLELPLAVGEGIGSGSGTGSVVPSPEAIVVAALTAARCCAGVAKGVSPCPGPGCVQGCGGGGPAGRGAILKPTWDPRAALPLGVRLPSLLPAEASELAISPMGRGGGGPAGLAGLLVGRASSSEEVKPEMLELGAASAVLAPGAALAFALGLREEIAFGILFGSEFLGIEIAYLLGSLE